MKINILGTEYTIERSNSIKDSRLIENDGYVDETVKKIVVDAFEQSHTNYKSDLQGNYAQKVLRHEIIHAFFFESGLVGEDWAQNEDLVDWIAFQFPKMLEAFKAANCI